MRFTEVNLIADPLHGYVEVTNGSAEAPGERAIIDGPWMQRLRGIHQLQSAWWVFPAAEHSRFVHLLGAMHLASRFARRIDASLRASCPGTPSSACVEETLRIAGLLHDVGHGPFGHFCDAEYLGPRFGIDHEDIGRHLIMTELADVIGSLRSSPEGHFDSGEQIDPRWVAWVMAPADLPGFDPPLWLRACKPLLCGPATVDNLDYVPRDAYMGGVSIGPVDVSRILHYTFVHDQTLVLHAHAVGALEMFLTSRLFMYMHVYMHRTVRRFDLSMREVYADTLDRMLPGSPLEHPDAYRGLTDWALLERVRSWLNAPAKSQERRLGEAWARILARDLPWRPVYETVLRWNADVSDLRAQILATLPAAHREMAFEVDVASTRIAPHNPMADDGMVAIYDPLHGSVERSRTQELLARLPQHNQAVRIFTNDEQGAQVLHRAARTVLGPDPDPRTLELALGH